MKTSLHHIFIYNHILSKKRKHEPASIVLSILHLMNSSSPKMWKPDLCRISEPAGWNVSKRMQISRWKRIDNWRSKNWKDLKKVFSFVFFSLFPFFKKYGMVREREIESWQFMCVCVCVYGLLHPAFGSSFAWKGVYFIQTKKLSRPYWKDNKLMTEGRMY